MILVFIGGTLMNTAQSSLPALAAGYYPTQGRATGVGWMLGLGRFGGIAGSFLVAELARRNLAFSDIFTIVAIPGLISAAALIVKQLVSPESRRTAPADRREVLGHWPNPIPGLSALYRVGVGVAEGVEEEGGDDGAGLGAGGVGASPDLRRPVQQPHNPPLLVEGGERETQRLQEPVEEAVNSRPFFTPTLKTWGSWPFSIQNR